MTRIPSTPDTRSEVALRWVGAVAAAIVFTWPLADVKHPTLASHDDPLFSTWRLAWIAHQLPRNPVELFNGNIFFPELNTLAYSDAMLLLGVIGAPFIWLGVPAVVVHNGLVVAAFVTALLAMRQLMAYFTASREAQVVAAIVFAFAPYRMAHIVHLELLWTAFLALALLSLYRLLEHPTSRRGLALGAAVGLQGLCSVYYMVFLAIWLVPAAALARLHIAFKWSRQHLAALVVALLTTALLVSPYVVPYARARAALGARPAHEVLAFSASLRDYLRASPNNLLYGHPKWGGDDELSLFVGSVPLVFAIVAVAVVRSRTTVALALLAVAAVDLSLGVNGISFSVLSTTLPVLDGFRAPARFGALMLLVVALLCGLATERLLASVRGMRRHAAALVLCAALFVEYWTAPLATYEVPLSPGKLEHWLASQPRTGVVVLPLPTPTSLWGHETVFQYLSIFHWQPMVNGYSGHAPKSYIRMLESLEPFPTEAAIQRLIRNGIRMVVLYDRYAGPGEFDRLLYTCQNHRWFTDTYVFEDQGRGRSAACRLRH